MGEDVGLRAGALARQSGLAGLDGRGLLGRPGSGGVVVDGLLVIGCIIMWVEQGKDVSLPVTHNSHFNG